MGVDIEMLFACYIGHCVIKSFKRWVVFVCLLFLFVVFCLLFVVVLLCFFFSFLFCCFCLLVGFFVLFLLCDGGGRICLEVGFFGGVCMGFFVGCFLFVVEFYVVSYLLLGFFVRMRLIKRRHSFVGFVVVLLIGEQEARKYI